MDGNRNRITYPHSGAMQTPFVIDGEVWIVVVG